MKHASFQKFIDLVTFDKKYHELKEQLEVAQKAIDDCTSEHMIYEAKVRAVTATKEAAHKSVKDSELEIKSLEEKEAHHKDILSQAANVKEQRAAKTELEDVQYKRSDLESSLGKLWSRYESLSERFLKIEAESKEEATTFAEAIKSHNETIARVQKEMASYDTDRIAKAEGVNAKWMGMYDIMKGRAKDPVVPVAQESCSVCFYAITAQDLQKLKQNELLQCKDCYRLLYFNEEVAEEQESAE